MQAGPQKLWWRNLPEEFGKKGEVLSDIESPDE
jgi:hypothetical protein